MRKLVIVLAATAGFGLLSSGGAIAAPFGGAVLNTAASSATLATEVSYRHRPRHCCGCYCRPVKWKKVCVKWKWVKVRY